MKNYTKIALICGVMALCTLLSACSQFGGGREQIDNLLDKIYGTAAPDTTAPGTTAPGGSSGTATEPVVRYDYFTNDMSAFVKLEKSDYTAFTAKVGKDYVVTDEMLESQLKATLYKYATATNGNTQIKDQPIRYGDQAYIYYRGEVDGEEFEGGSNMSDKTPYKLGIGSGAFIPGFEEGLIGVVPAETGKDNPHPISLTFPENYHPDLAGKDVIFYVVVEYVVQYDVPELTDAFVKDTIKYKPENELPDQPGAYVDSFKAYLKKSMEDAALEAAEQRAYSMAMEELMSKLTFTGYPEGEVEYYVSAEIAQMEQYFAYYKTLYGVETLDEFALIYLELEEGADWRKELTEFHQETVKQKILLHAIAEAEGFEQVTDEEFNAEVEYLLEYYAQYNLTAETLRKEMGDDNIKEGILSSKLYDLIMERTVISYE